MTMVGSVDVPDNGRSGLAISAISTHLVVVRAGRLFRRQNATQSV